MGTLKIMYNLLVYIQGEAHPVYIAARRNTVRWPVNLDPSQWGGVLFFVLLIGLAVFGFVGQQMGLQVSAYHDELLGLLMIFGGGLLSLTWTVPFAMLAGQGIGYERTAQTWDALMVTPYSTDVILLAKAAADLRLVWDKVIPAVFMSLFLATAATVPTIFASGKGIVLSVVFIALALVAIAVERAQELALAVVIGLLINLQDGSRRTAMMIGLLAGVTIRLLQMIFVLLVSMKIAPDIGTQFTFLNIVIGTPSLITTAPSLISLIIVGGVILVREGMIRVLFGWVLRRARED
ncbi:MAG: hypothetical protein ABI947_11690 [Chloroflexota bacterium]